MFEAPVFAATHISCRHRLPTALSRCFSPNLSSLLCLVAPGEGAYLTPTSLRVTSRLPARWTPGSGLPVPCSGVPVPEPLCPLPLLQATISTSPSQSVLCPGGGSSWGCCKRTFLGPRSDPPAQRLGGRGRCTCVLSLRPHPHYPRGWSLIHLHLWYLERGKPHSGSSVNVCGMDY